MIHSHGRRAMSFPLRNSYAGTASDPSPLSTTSLPQRIRSSPTRSTRSSSPTSTPPGGPTSREPGPPRHRRRLHTPSAPYPSGPRPPAHRDDLGHHVRDRRRANQVDARTPLGTTQPRHNAHLPRRSDRLPYDQQVAVRWGELQGYAQLRGRPRPVNDTWIAACCLTRELPLATLNLKDFADFAEHEGLELIRS